MGTEFTYQGELKQVGSTADGSFDFKIDLYDVEIDGVAVATTVELENVSVVDGVFTVPLDFGSAPFAAGEQLWLEIAVREGNSVADHTVLLPRQKLTATPVAIASLGHGYYADHTHDDRYYTKTQSDQMLPFVVMSDAITSLLTSAATIVQSVEVNAPSAGNVLLNYSAIVVGSPDDRFFCNVGTGATVEDTNGASVSEIPSTRTTLVGTRMIAVSAGSTTVNLVCRLVIGTGTRSVFNPTITALFVPTGA